MKTTSEQRRRSRSRRTLRETLSVLQVQARGAEKERVPSRLSPRFEQRYSQQARSL
jgi:hypothetical protein